VIVPRLAQLPIEIDLNAKCSITAPLPGGKPKLVIKIRLNTTHAETFEA
jgi:hypothetical protein